jgi:uncharacterized PurR-regulated membrane protein YhhQ (DUF165 family)
MKTTVVLVSVYLVAIVAANQIITHQGPTWSIYTAFVFIGLDLVTRDRLHDAWKGRVLRNMALLILAGSVISYAVNRNSGRIALASCLAFGLAATADGVVYHLRRKERWADRSNESNVAGAGVDSLIFPLVAFGTPVLWAIMFGQFTAKVAGGYLWSLVLRKRDFTAAWAGRDMRVTYEVQATAIVCPVDESVIDIYSITIISNRVITVERINEVLAKVAASPIYQEDFTIGVAELLACGQVITVGDHSGVRTTCVAGLEP